MALHGLFRRFSLPRPPAKPKRPVSIRRRLQTTTLLTVLAGYGLLLVLHHVLSGQSRLQAHQQTIGLIRQELLQRRSSRSGAVGLQELLDQIITPGMVVWLQLDKAGIPFRLPKRDATFPLPLPLNRLLAVTDVQTDRQPGPVTFVLGGHTYLASDPSLVVAGQPARLLFLQDFSREAERERLTQLLLMAAAGLSSLFTSLLLRPAIRKGLEPLDLLSNRLEGISSSTLKQQSIPLDRQPPELVTIATSFNDLLGRLAQAWERQRAFVNGVSHELRTPITLIGGYAGKLRRGSHPLDANQQEQIQLIEAEARRMGHLVTDLLDLSRWDSGKLKLDCRPIDPWTSLERIQERFQELSAGRLHLGEVPADADRIQAEGNDQRLEQCLANVIGNALKYAPGSTPIDLRVSSTPEELILHVVDRGPGIPDADKQKVFERFQRGSTAGDTNGSGIGLAVVWALMECMGGRVRVADAPGGGADVQLALRRATGLPSPGRN